MLFAEGLRDSLPPARAAGRGDAAARWPKWAEGQVLAFNIADPAERANSVTSVLMQGRDPRAAARLLPRQVRRGARAWASASSTARPSASPTWATSTRRWCWARWAAVEMGLEALGIPHGSGRRAGRGRLARRRPCRPDRPARPRSISAFFDLAGGVIQDSRDVPHLRVAEAAARELQAAARSAGSRSPAGPAAPARRPGPRSPRPCGRRWRRRWGGWPPGTPSLRA